MKSILVFLLMATAVSGARAELYRWVDENGAVTYQDQPPPEEVTTASMVKLPSFGRSGKKRKPPVLLYRTPDCAPCDYAEQFLQRKHVAVRSIDVSSDPDNQQALREKAGNLSVPTLVLAGKVIKGFTPSWLASELDAAGYTQPQEPAHRQEEDLDADESAMSSEMPDDYPHPMPQR